MNSAEVQTPVPRPRCSKVSDPSAQVSSEGSSSPLPTPVMTAQTTTIGSTKANARAIRPSPEGPKPTGTVNAGPTLASRPNTNPPIAVPREAMALTVLMVAVDSTP